jgi:hypothetical protein
VRSGIYGYGHVSFTPKQAMMSVRTVQSRRDPQSPLSTTTRFAVEAGKPGAVPA